MTTPSDLTILTAFFNPYGYHSKKKRYIAFRNRIAELGISLKTIEIVYADNEPELIGDEVIRINTNDALCHNERAINNLVAKLDSSISKIAWCDSNVLIEDADWARKVSDSLQEKILVQAFRQATLFDDLDQTPKPDKVAWGSIAALVEYGSLADSKPGYLWAIRRETLSSVGLYDVLITGGADLALLFAALFDKSNPILWAKSALELELFRAMSEEYRNHYMAWVDRFHRAVNGSIGYVSSEIRVPFEAGVEGAVKKFFPLSKINPESDLQVSANGLLTWNDVDPKVIGQVRATFMALLEDGNVN